MHTTNTHKTIKHKVENQPTTLTFALDDNVPEDGRLPVGDLQELVVISIFLAVEGLGVDLVHRLGDAFLGRE